MAAISKRVLIALLSLAFSASVHGTIVLRDFYMKDLCGRTFNVSSVYINSFLLEMKNSQEGPELLPSCWMRIQAPPGLSVYFHLISLNIRGPATCSDSYLRVMEGEDIKTSTVIQNWCGNVNSQKFTTGQNAFLEVKSTDAMDNFKMTVAFYHTGPCTREEILCSNGRCVDSGTSCNHYDLCGDNSKIRETCLPSSRGRLWWLWILLGISGFVLLVSIVVIAVCCVCRKKRRNGTVIKQTEAGYIVKETDATHPEIQTSLVTVTTPQYPASADPLPKKTPL